VKVEALKIERYTQYPSLYKKQDLGVLKHFDYALIVLIEG
jgi:hypothetical protein